jgi:hypothetical protein
MVKLLELLNQLKHVGIRNHLIFDQQKQYKLHKLHQLFLKFKTIF